MKIYFIAGHSIVGQHKTGVQIHDINIIMSLIESGYDVRILDYRSKSEYKEEELNESNNKIILDRIVFSRIAFKYSVRLPLWVSFGNNSPGKHDICIVDSVIPIGIKKEKTYAILHDLMPRIYPDYYVNILTEMKYLEDIKKLAGIWANSVSTKKDYLRFYDIKADRIHVVPCSIPDDYHEQLLANYTNNSNEKKQYFYYIGDMRKNKNLALAIKSFNIFIRTNDIEDCYFYIAGKKGKEYPTLEKLIIELGCESKIIFLGYIDEKEKARLILEARGLLFISEYEGFGIPVIEAMACGIPVITSDCSSLKEVAGDAALLVNPEQENSVVNALEKLYYKKFDIDTLVEKGINRASDYNRTAQKQVLSSIVKQCLKV